MSYGASSSNYPHSLSDLRGMVEQAIHVLESPQTPPPQFRGAALTLQTCQDYETIIAGPAETGKSHAMLWRLDTLLRETPNASAVLVRKVRADMDSTILETLRKIIAIRGGVEVFGGEHPKFYSYENGARLWIIGLDDPGKVLSSEHDFMFVNQAEELRLQDWEILSTRCTGRAGHSDKPQLVGDCNPSSSTHWILRREGLRLLHSRHEDNPVLFDEEAKPTGQGLRSLAVLDRLTGSRRERLRLGHWSSAEGVVYDNWSRALHLIPSFPIPSSWRRFRSTDFGYTNPFVNLWLTVDPDGRLYVYRQIYKTQTLVSRHAAEIRRLEAEAVVDLEGNGKGASESVEDGPADHDAEDRATLLSCGIRTMPALKAVSPGIQAVRTRLQIAGDGKPRLFVFEHSLVEKDQDLAAAYKPTCLEEEIEGYVWAKTPDGKPNKEEPLKFNDHAMDALRYAVAHVDGLSGADTPRRLLSLMDRQISEQREANA